jgi:hypothetical protein
VTETCRFLAVDAMIGGPFTWAIREARSALGI